MTFGQQIALAAIPLFTVFSSAAFSVNGVVVECNQDQQRLEIRYLWDATQKDWKHPQHLDFFDLLVVKRCEPEHRYAGAPCSVIRHRSKTIVCQLGGNHLAIRFEPYPFSDDLQGPWGAAVSGTVSISRNGKPLLGTVAFDDSRNCHDERVKVISEIIVEGRNSDVQIKESGRDF